MNVNEVIANRAIEILGGDKGDYSLIHPNDHVNMSQSTNDTFHVAMNITIFESLYNKLFPACERLIHVFSSKAKEFSKDIKTGRTHLMDAVPITLGQEFSGYAATLQENYRNLRISSNSLLELNFGGTAVGTGLNAPKEFSEIAIREINHMTGLDFKKADNFFKVTQNTLGAMRVSSGLREIALSLIKISNDIRLLASGPRTGIGEITLPEVQPGSSIMPGKINPVIAEMVNMVCFQVCGNDTAVSMAYQSAQLELNVFMPVIAHDILFSIHILSKAIDTLNEKCISGIQANSERCRELAEKSLSLVTILSPYIGYHKAAEIARRAYITGKTIKEVLVEDGVMNSEKAEKLLDPYSMV
jgi:aspartate ammonia-lyase